MALRRGKKVLVCYADEPELWHARLLVEQVRGRTWVVATPDLDLYDEELDTAPGDIIGIRVVVVEGTLPVGIGGGQVYDFADGVPDAAQMRRLRLEAKALVELAGAARDPEVEGGAAAAGPPSSDEIGERAGRARGSDEGAGIEIGEAPQEGHAGEEGKEWRVLRAVGELQVGDVVADHAVQDRRGHFGFAHVGAHILPVERVDCADAGWVSALRPLDARILPARQRASGKRGRTYEEAVRDSSQEHYADFPVKGPRTALWCVEFLELRRQTAMEHHARWVQVAKLQPQEWGVAEHESLCRVLDAFVTYDQVDASNLAGCEMVCRRIQVVEFYHLQRLRDGERGGGDKSKLSMDEVTALSGITRDTDNLMVCPELMDHAREEVERTQKIMKEFRKHREELALASKRP